ncbi:hypothetical protein GBA52_015040 [Prunus armeniaca]|nr:hypothetical protein GBA52_015040 [Prunus armeniaca]
MKIRDGGEAHIYTNPDMFTLEVHHGGYFVDGLYMGGENVEHYEDEHTAPEYDGDEENGQHEFVDVEIDEEFGEAEEEVEVESDEAEKGGEDEEEDGDFIDSEFEQSDEEDNMNFHR